MYFQLSLNNSNVNKEEKNICNFVVFCIFCLYVVNASYVLGALTKISSSIFSTVAKVLIGGLFIVMIPNWINRFNTKIFFLTFILGMIFASNYLLFPQYNSYFKETIVTFWTTCFIMMFSICCVNDYSLLVKKIEKLSYIIAWSCLLVIILRIINRSSLDSFYSMGFGYACLFPALFVVKSMFDKSSFLSILRFIIIIIAIILFGSRGPLIGIAVFTVCYLFLLLSKKQLKSKKTIFIILFLLFSLTLLIFHNSISHYLLKIFAHFGVRSRTVELLFGDLFYSSGRDAVQETVLNDILSSPFNVRGIHSDAFIAGTYSHNLILEIIHEFGLFFGGLFLLTILVLVIKTIFSKKKEDDYYLLLILMCACLPKLMVSGTIWTTYIFWMWFGLMVTKKRSMQNTIIMSSGAKEKAYV